MIIDVAAVARGATTRLITVIDDDPTGAQARGGCAAAARLWDARLELRGRRARRRRAPADQQPRARRARGCRRCRRAARAALARRCPSARIVLRGDSTLRGAPAGRSTRRSRRGVRRTRGVPLVLVPRCPRPGASPSAASTGSSATVRACRSTTTEYARDGALRLLAASRLLDWARGALRRPLRRRRRRRGAGSSACARRRAGRRSRLARLAQLGGAGRPAALVPDAETHRRPAARSPTGCARARDDGVELIVRCAPAFVGVAAGTTRRAARRRAPAGDGVLVVVGSLVPTHDAPARRARARAGPGRCVEVRRGRARRRRRREARSRRRPRPRASASRPAGSRSSRPTRERDPRAARRASPAMRIAHGARARSLATRARPTWSSRQGRHHLGGERRATASARARRGSSARSPTASRSGGSPSTGADVPGRLPGQRRRRRAARRPRRARRSARLRRDAQRRSPSCSPSAAPPARGLGAFTCYDLETARGVLRGGGRARRRGDPAARRAARRSREPAATCCSRRCVAVAERSPARACVQLDHVGDLELIERAFEAGAGAVMADGSKLPLEENVALVARGRRARARVRRRGRGRARPHQRRRGRRRARRRPGSSPIRPRRRVRGARRAPPASRSRSATCTAPTASRRRSTGRGSPAIREPRTGAALAARRLGPPGRGRSRRAIAAGIAKVNVNTELREAYLAATGGSARRSAATATRLLELHRPPERRSARRRRREARPVRRGGMRRMDPLDTAKRLIGAPRDAPATPALLLDLPKVAAQHRRDGAADERAAGGAAPARQDPQEPDPRADADRGRGDRADDRDRLGGERDGRRRARTTS